MKRYLKMNVLEASVKRIDYVLRNFPRTYVSFSGGKDSGVLLHLVMERAEAICPDRKIGVLIVDLEGQYQATIDYIKNVLDEYHGRIEPYWVCLPLNLRNAVSSYEPFWRCWDEKARSSWIRDLPDRKEMISDPSFFPFFRKGMEFEEFTPAFGEWYANGQKTACFVGIRSDESLNRWRTIASATKARYSNKPWTTKVSDTLYNAYPIYDWQTKDIWIANSRFRWSYNKLYDLMQMAGVSLARQRICQPYGDDQKIGLNLFRVIEPMTWNKVVNRVSGANFGNIYCGTKITGFQKVDLPEGHSWRSYTKYLLASLPDKTRENYTRRFVQFMRWWHKQGSPATEEAIEELPPDARVLNQRSARGTKDKRLARYVRIPDTLPGNLDARKAGPSWRRMAICIIKHDHLCKSLSFTQTKNQQEQIANTLKRYESL
ncbi:MAG: DUF3440 domain-containing protein [Pseudomonadota bacterium]